MKRLPLLLCLVALALGVSTAACGSVNPAAATVNGTRISQKDLDAELKAIEGNTQYVSQIESGGNSVKGSGSGTLTNAFVSRVLTRQIFLLLVHDELVRKHLTVKPSDIASGQASVVQSVGGDAVWKKFPKSYQQTLLRRNAEVDVLQAALSDVKIDAAAIQAYYDQHPDEFAQSCVSHILFSVIGADGSPDQAATAAQIDSLRAQAVSVKKQIDAGADFAAMAKQYSTDAGSKDTGGDLDCGASGRFVPAFDAAVAALSVGQVSDPVQTQFGIHLIKLTNRTTQSLADATPQIQQQLQQQSQTGISNFLQAALGKAKVSVNPRYGTFSKDSQNPGVVPPEAPTTLPPSGATTTTPNPLAP